MNGVDLTPSAELDEREALRISIEEDKAELLDAVVELKEAVQSRFQLRERIANAIRRVARDPALTFCVYGGSQSPRVHTTRLRTCRR